MSDNWNSIGKKFYEKFNVHVDLRNHGRSFRSHEFSYSHVRDIEEYIKYYDLQNPILGATL